jgi:hypothetical protein
VDQAWCTQAQAVQGFGEFALPDRIIREDELAAELSALAQGVGVQPPATMTSRPVTQPYVLADIYDAEIEKLTSDAYQRDYMIFGFNSWG